MGVEVERKFLVSGDSWRAEVTSSTRIVQGYLAQTDSATVRVRVKGERGFLTVKGVSVGIARSEYEYEIPVADALAMLDRLAQGPGHRQGAPPRPRRRPCLGGRRVRRGQRPVGHGRGRAG